MKKSIRQNKNERGFLISIMGAGLAVFLGFFALVADLGNIYLTKSQLQNTADSAALAASIEIPLGVDEAEQRAIEFGQSHYAAGDQVIIDNGDVQFGNYDFLTGQLVLDQVPTNAVVVTARRVEGSTSGPLPLFFAPLFGRDFSNVQARSTALLDPHVVGVQGKNRLIPYSVIDFVVDQDADGLFDVGETINIHPRNDAPGNFGFLDLDGGSNDTTELRQYIEEGYDGEFVIPPGGSVEVSGSTGITGNSLLNSFNVIVGEIAFLPVHNWVINPGDNAIFNVISLLGVEVKDVKLNGNPEARYIQVEIINVASSVLVVDPEAPANNSVAKPRLALA